MVGNFESLDPNCGFQTCRHLRNTSVTSSKCRFISLVPRFHGPGGSLALCRCGWFTGCAVRSDGWKCGLGRIL